MPYLDHLTLPSGGTYELHDKRIDNLNEIMHISSTAADTPQGIKWTPAGGTEITGTLAPDGTFTIGGTTFKATQFIFLVYSPNDDTGDTYEYMD